MYKTLLRTLSALSIVTITASAGFAQEDRIKTCTGDESQFCSLNERFCAANPFSPMFENGENCMDVLRSHYRTAVVRFCGKPANKDNQGCDSVLNKPNVANWSHNSLEGTIDVLNTTNRKNQFLRGKESVLLTNGAFERGSSRIRFDNRIHGVSYFHTETDNEKHFYAGILSGTDLGELVTEVAGLAVWSGKFGATGDNHVLPVKSFKLHVDFGNKKLTAFIDRSFGTVPSSEGALHFSIDGRFGGSESGGADTGLITGKVELRRFLMNDKTQPTGVIESATLSGLIGTDGVVGVFISDDDGDGSSTQRTYGHFSGGFIATPPSASEKRTLLDNCGTDPFNSVCFSDTTHNKKREAQCLTNPNLPKCIFTVTRVCEVEENPFDVLCKAKYEPARVARVELCNVDTEDPLCGDKFASKICAYDPFSAICFNGGGGATPEDRAERIRLCEGANPTVSCNTARKRPNVANWINSFAEAGTALASDRDGEDPKNEFLKDTLKGLKPQGTKLFNRLDYAAVVSDLDLSTATFGGRALGGDVNNGVSFFRGWDSTHGKYLHYAAVWTGTDLGAPLMGNTGKAGWVGHFETAGFYAVSQTDFILEVNFDSGSIKAFVPYSGDQFFSLDGTFDDSGLIEGTSELAYFRNQNRELKDESKASNTGLLRGLIGANGALGVFLSDEIGALNGKHAYSGGFVARVNDNINHILTVLNACDINPFGLLCNLDYETERADTINLCIEGDTMLASPDICRHAVARHPCIENPFAEECVTDFAQYYEAAQAKRFAFCDSNSTGGSIHPHCVVALGRPNAATWANSFTSPALNTDPGPKNQFLAIAGNKISTEGTSNALGNGNPTVYKLDFSDFTHNGASVVGLDAADGLAYFEGTRSGSRFEYAGIYGTTDLGAPITESGFSATWAGKLQVDTFSMVDFDLTVTFDGADGTLTGVRQNFTGFRDFIIDGKFDAKGVITGKVHNQIFLPEITLAHPLRNGILSGIIGQEGAVGVFHGTSGYSGGFVAVPTTIGPIATACAGDSGDPICPDDDVTKVTAKDWQRGQPAPLNTYATARNQFLQIVDKTISTIGADLYPSGVGGGGIPSIQTLDFGAFTSGGVSLGLDDDNGLAHFRAYVDDIRYQYVGIYGTTDLGAPIATSGFSAAWAGKLRISGISVKDFTLAVTFDGTTGRLDVFLTDVKKEVDFLIDGEFDANGVITGDVHYAEFDGNVSTATADRNGTLSGIIGSGGAVGVFHSNTDETAYRGGFVAVPDTVAYADWVSSFGYIGLRPFTHAPQNEILQGVPSDMSSIGITVSVRDSLNLADATFDGKPLGGDATDGVAFFSGTNRGGGSKLYYYAGLLSGTNLGAPVSETSGSATWNGRFRFVHDSNVRSADFPLTVNFTGTATTAGSISAFIPRTRNNINDQFKITGTFDNNGVISGDVFYGGSVTADTDSTTVTDTRSADYVALGPGTLTGLIGQEGAVGAFVADNYYSGRHYSGGFVAAPPAESANP